jgi:hypothetical protein
MSRSGEAMKDPRGLAAPSLAARFQVALHVQDRP